LLGYSLVEWNAAAERYGLHQLARVFAAGQLSEKERGESRRRHAAHYAGVLREANEQYLQGGDVALAGLNRFDWERGNIRAGQAWAAAHSEEDEEAARRCSAYADAGEHVLGLRLHPRELIGWLEAGLAAARRRGDRDIEGTALGNLGSAYYSLGEPRRAVQLYERALAISRELGDRRGEGLDLWNASLTLDVLGDRSRAIESAAGALAILEAIEDPTAGRVREQLAAWGQEDGGGEG
jgi:tetratricopeptide (TPR) repeat protein